MRFDRNFWVILGLGLSVRALVLVGAGPNPEIAFTSDSPSYTEPARQLRSTGRFSRMVSGLEQPETYRTPGYPVFLIPFFTTDDVLRHRAVQWAQVLLNALSSGLVYLAALAFWQNKRAALLAGAGMALDFVNAVHCLFILTDILFVFALALLLLCLVQKRYALSGLCVALAALIRPAGLYYPLLLAMLVFIQSKKHLPAFLCLSLLPLILWMGRNYAASGSWAFTSLQSANLVEVRAALVEAEREGVPYEQALERIHQAYAPVSKQMSPQQWGARYLLTHWRAYTKLLLKDMAKLFTGNSIKVAAWVFLKDEAYDPAVTPGHAQSSPLEQARDLARRHPALGAGLAAYFLFLGLVYTAAAFGVWRALQEHGRAVTLLLFSSVLYFVVITLGVDAQARYRLPIMPALFLFAGGGYKVGSLRKETS